MTLNGNNQVVVEGYERWMRSWNASDRTIEARVSLARARLKVWGLTGFTADNVQTFLGSEGWTRWTRATYHGHLSSLCEYLVAAGHLDCSPMDDVRKIRRPKSLPNPLSDREMGLALAKAATHPDPRILEWIVLARRQGLRCHEIAKFRGEDLSERGLYVLGKGGKEVVLPVHADVATIAMRRPGHGYWYPSPYGVCIQPKTLSKVVSAFFDSLGIEGSIHRVRHNFGTDLVEAGNDLRVVQELMRHSSLATTEGYTLVRGDRLAAALGRLPASLPAPPFPTAPDQHPPAA